jgi:hypothetical protein
VFERLHEDWSTLPQFQRTRGVLRLMARWVHSLWRADNRDLLILPGSVPLDDRGVRNELLKYLPSGWDPIVDKEVDGPDAGPRRIDDSTPTLGSLQACRRAARTIFLGSAPSVSGQNVRGVGVERVRLGCAQPGQSPARYDDALRRLSDQLHYLYTGNERFWFDQRPNLRREMEDRMRRFDVQIYPELQERLRKLVKGSVVQAVHVFEDSKDIPDTIDLRLVVLEPDSAHKRKDSGSKAIAAAEAILARHGHKPREYQNRVLFLVADAAATQTLRDQVSRYLAWTSIVNDADELELDKHRDKEARKSQDEASRRVEASIKETYRILLVPVQDPDAPEGLTKIRWEDDTLSLSGSAYDKAITTAVREKEWVLTAWAPAHLASLLSRWFWKDDTPAVGAKKLWLDSCRFLYLPRISTPQIVLQTIRDGVGHKDWFAYASGTEQDGRYTGMIFGVNGGGGVDLDDSSLLVRPDVAASSMPAPDAGGAADAPSHTPAGNAGPRAKTGSGGVAPRPVVSRRFHATAEIDEEDPIGSFTQVVQEVIALFTSHYGTTVSISVDIDAKTPDGFEPKLIRIVKENATTLRFRTAEFEDD